MTGSSTQGIKTVLHPVSDLATAQAVYAAIHVLVLLRRRRGRGPAHRAGAGRWTAGHALTGGLLARAGHRGEAGRGDRRGCHREGARARRRWRPPGGHRHRPRWQCPRAASGPMSAGPRSRAQRRRDTEHRLNNDIDVWVASASADGAPYLVPLSFDWDGEALLMATPADSPTGRNLAATRAVRLGLGHTRDVSMIEGEVEVLEIDALPQQRGDRFAARTGFDPRALGTPYRWFRISPRRIQAWREVNELPDRELMRDGRWLV